MNTDSYGRIIYSEEDVVRILYANPDIDLTKLYIQDTSVYNSSVDSLYSELDKLCELDNAGNPEDFHLANQSNWHMPDEYKSLDIAKWLLDQCTCDAELQRVGEELLLYHEKRLFDLLKFLKYFVDTCKHYGVVLGVGRGSSVASFVLYLIGVHKVNSLYYDLDITEFLR